MVLLTLNRIVKDLDNIEYTKWHSTPLFKLIHKYHKTTLFCLKSNLLE